MPPGTTTSMFLLLLASSSMTAGREPGNQPKRHCKASPGTPSWPSTESWARLNESVDGRLLRPSPPGAVCHPGQPTFNTTQCAAVKTAWSTYEFHSDDPVSVDWNQWSNDTCLPEPSHHCSGAGYPQVVMNASTAAHVKAGVDFARKNGIRLVVKSTGHDFLGRSTAPNSLSIWTHHLKQGPKFHDSFRPKNCDIEIKGTAVTAGAGTQMIELYSALDVRNQTVVGGGGKTVSLGGYITGGGHSLLAPRYGLAADQVLEATLVTPTGDILTVNECTSPSLFWAIRGGGGSTFGILTSVTLLTHPTPHLSSISLTIATPTNSSLSASTFPMIAYTLSQFPPLSDSGLSGYTYFFSALPSPVDNGASTVSGIFLFLSLLDGSPSDIDSILAPLICHINMTWPGFYFSSASESYPTFLSWFQSHYDKSAAGSDSLVGSRLLSHSALTAKLTQMAEALELFASAQGIATAYLVSGKGVHNAKPREGSNAVHPAWRKAYVHATNGVEWKAGDETERREKTRALERSLVGLRGLDEKGEEGGAYVNEAYPWEPNWQRAFWGSNYERLLQIKREVDPDDVLWCHPCVGNERWEELDGQLCRVKD